MSTLYYIHDPMCSWCWGFSRTLNETLAALPRQILVIRLLGGLAPDSDAAMPDDMQRNIAETWRRISAHIPGVQFNFDFWTICSPRRSTYPACRAVIAARQQGDQYDIAMTRAIQLAYYRQARNPSDDAILIELAGELGLDTRAFALALNSSATQAQLMREIARVHDMGVDSFPSLVLEQQGRYRQIPIDYNNSQPMLERIKLTLRETS